MGAALYVAGMGCFDWLPRRDVWLGDCDAAEIHGGMVDRRFYSVRDYDGDLLGKGGTAGKPLI